MKKFLKTIAIVILVSLANPASSQGPPDPPDNPNEGGGPVGGSAPLENGLMIMLSLAAFYSSAKYWSSLRKEELSEEY